MLHSPSAGPNAQQGKHLRPATSAAASQNRDLQHAVLHLLLAALQVCSCWLCLCSLMIVCAAIACIIDVQYIGTGP